MVLVCCFGPLLTPEAVLFIIFPLCFSFHKQDPMLCSVAFLYVLYATFQSTDGRNVPVYAFPENQTHDLGHALPMDLQGCPYVMLDCPYDMISKPFTPYIK